MSASQAILSRMLRLKYVASEGARESTGSGFSMNWSGRKVIVTCMHLFSWIESGSTIELSTMVNDEWQRTTGTIYFHENPNVDIAIVVLNQYPVGGESTHEEHLLTHTDWFLGQDVLFFGYPYGRYINGPALADGRVFPLPFAKKAIISAMMTESDGVSRIWLDAINNSGFSGGPVVVLQSPGPRQPQIIGIVKGFVGEELDVTTSIGITHKILVNSGIAEVHNIVHALEILRSRVATA